MKTLKQTVQEAREKKVAVGHFNISNLEALWGIFRAAQSLNVPVIIGVSEGERDFVGVKQVAAVVKSIREEYDYPIYLNADHTYSFDKVKEAIDAGFDSVIVDGAKLSFEENVKMTKQCVDYARASGREVLVEAELGYIGQSSKVLDEIPEGVMLDESSLTDPAKAKEFVELTGVDMLAPAVGNFHGMLRGGVDPKLNIERVKAISDSTGIPLVLHGGSGNSEDDFKQAIANGINIVHINTEIRLAFRDAVKKALQENPDEVAPYKFLKPGMLAVQEVVTNKLKFFNNL
ncbi:MAG TPA: class II fructose-bisphosphate aldolase family protein [Parcubacteria group bacterium]|nr:class II fructose-bisphosphate aldolase family protein [Parcubacteria group bacterium]